MIRICQKNIRTFIFSKKREDNLFLKNYVIHTMYVVVSIQKLGSLFTFINIFTLNT